MTRHFVLAFVCLATSFVSSWTLAEDADWPQWRGPNRDGHAATQSLLQEWPAGGPKMKWEFRETGIGYSAFSIVGDRLYTMGSKGHDCFTMCIDTAAGKLVWETITSRAAVEGDYAHGWGGGPRSTPTVDGEFVYSLSDVGVLACLQRNDGKLLWSVDYVNDFGGSIPKWGFSESVLIDGDRVIGTPGGTEFMVGLDKKTGKKVWATKEVQETAQYVSPMKHSIGNVSFYVNASKAGLIGVDATSGKALFRNAATGNEVAVIPTPIVTGDLLYHTSDYGAGNTLLQLTAGENGTVATQSVYHLSTKSMQNHHGGVVLVDGVIYGFTKSGGGEWMAQDLKSGETLWTEKLRPNRSGSISYADGRLYCYNDEDGSVILVEPSRDGWKKHGEMKLPEKTKIERGNGAIWAHPIIAGQTLYLRDQDLIFAFDIAG
ncbi:MAG: PQQ-binding-like beta-propeller repeat protein [Planctomycetaceae bacterium]